jgi:hypothetical protein
MLLTLNTEVSQHHRTKGQPCFLIGPVNIPKVPTRAGGEALTGANVLFPIPNSFHSSINLCHPEDENYWGDASPCPHFENLSVSCGVHLSFCPRELPTFASSLCEPMSSPAMAYLCSWTNQPLPAIRPVCCHYHHQLCIPS